MGLSYVWQAFFHAAQYTWASYKRKFCPISIYIACIFLLIYIYILCYEYTILIFFLWCMNESMRKLSNARQRKRLWCCSHTIHLLNALHTRNKDVLINMQGFIWTTLRVQQRTLFVWCDIIIGTKPWRNRIKGCLCPLKTTNCRIQHNNIIRNFCLLIIKKLFKFHLNPLWYHYD